MRTDSQPERDAESEWIKSLDTNGHAMLFALKAILALDPNEQDEGFNEWGEAACFRLAQDIARDCLIQIGDPGTRGA